MADMQPIQMTWTGGMKFEGGKVGGPSFVLDGDAAVAPSPVDALVAAVAACSGIDVVAILEKMQQPLKALVVHARATRADEYPKRLTKMHLTYEATGTGLDLAKVRRAAELSTTKYCSVMQSLAKDTDVEWDVTLVEG